MKGGYFLSGPKGGGRWYRGGSANRNERRQKHHNPTTQEQQEGAAPWEGEDRALAFPDGLVEHHMEPIADDQAVEHAQDGHPRNLNREEANDMALSETDGP